MNVYKACFLLPALFLSACSSGIDENNGINNDTKPFRVESNIVARYDFNEGSGTIIHDTSYVDAPLDLTLSDLSSVEWQHGSLKLLSPSEITSKGANGQDARADKIYQYLEASNELSIEAWVTPSGAEQIGADEPARILTLSGDTSTQGFVLGQEADQWVGRVRTDTTAGYAGRPSLQSGAMSAGAALTHVVFTWSGTSKLMKIYVNGEFMDQLARPDYIAGINTDGSVNYVWDRGHSLRIGYERVAGDTTITDTWLGELHFAAIYSQALSADEVKQNYLAGPP